MPPVFEYNTGTSDGAIRKENREVVWWWGCPGDRITQGQFPCLSEEVSHSLTVLRGVSELDKGTMQGTSSLGLVPRLRQLLW